MSEPDDANYLIQLRTAWIDAGQPSSRKLADRAGMSHTNVARILRGGRPPTLWALTKIAEALASPEEAQRIIAAYEQELINLGAEPPRSSGGTKGDTAQAIRDGLADIADAIRSLNVNECCDHGDT